MAVDGVANVSNDLLLLGGPRVLFAMVRDNAFYSSPVLEENLNVAA